MFLQYSALGKCWTFTVSFFIRFKSTLLYDIYINFYLLNNKMFYSQDQPDYTADVNKIYFMIISNIWTKI